MKNILCTLILLAAISAQATDKKPVKVFILAGQSNMEGKGKVDPLLNHQIHAPETKEFFAHFHKDGKYIEREDVWINFLNRRGRLTVGFGSPGRIGPELEFGHVVGDHYEEPVLIIKTAWGGKSIGRDFRPPSSGLPSKEELDEAVNNMVNRDYNNLVRNAMNKAKKENPKVTRKDIEAQLKVTKEMILKEKGVEFRKQVIDSQGHFYRLMMEEIAVNLKELKQRFPDYDGRGYELAGFVWFQGFNDQFSDEFKDNYRDMMVHFIKDVRKEYNAPGMPFVIGVLGTNMTKEDVDKNAVSVAQREAAKAPEFKDNVTSVESYQVYDLGARAVYDKGWAKNFAVWRAIGSDRPYHYLGSGTFFARLGDSFATAMNDLIGKQKK